MKNRCSFPIVLDVLQDFLKILPFTSFVRSRSYSQFWEDRLIARILKSDIGSYVDVGAGAPTWGSNSYYFYKLGWTGVTIDPIAFNMKMQRLVRPRDTQYQSLVSAKQSNVVFFQLSPWELSTTDSLMSAERISRGAKLVGEYLCGTISLSMVYQKHPMSRPSLLSIDVEGSEMDVLLSNDWTNNKPDIICVEELGKPLQSSEIRKFLLLQEYELVAYNGVSAIYSWIKSAHLQT